MLFHKHNKLVAYFLFCFDLHAWHTSSIHIHPPAEASTEAKSHDLKYEEQLGLKRAMASAGTRGTRDHHSRGEGTTRHVGRLSNFCGTRLVGYHVHSWASGPDALQQLCPSLLPFMPTQNNITKACPYYKAIFIYFLFHERIDV